MRKFLVLSPLFCGCLASQLRPHTLDHKIQIDIIADACEEQGEVIEGTRCSVEFLRKVGESAALIDDIVNHKEPSR